MERIGGLKERWAPSGWSLRLRLVGSVVVLMVAGLAVTGTLGVTLLRSYLVAQVDQQLDGLAHVPGGAPSGAFPRVLPQGSQTGEQLPTPFVFTVLSKSGSVVVQIGGSAAGGADRPNLSSVDAAKVRAEHGKPFTVPAFGGRSRFRVVAVANSDGTSTVVGLSLASSDATVGRLELITIIAAAVVLALLGVLAMVLVGLGLRPLRTVELTAERISGGDLSGRVPPGNPRTEVGRLAATLNVMLGQIEWAFAERARSETTLRQFIADASHELRTPLTTVRGYAEVVNRGALTTEEDRRHAMRRIESEAARMSGLVEDLLLLAYLDQQRPLFTGLVDLAPLVKDTVADARARAPQRRVESDVPEQPVTVNVDADRMRQVLGNLLSNALVHTPETARVRVGLTAVADEAVITVADDGPGVPGEALDHLFERFYRADPGRSRARGGTGLGLSIVAAVVAASGGTVTCTSELGEGSTFTMRLPLVP